MGKAGQGAKAFLISSQINESLTQNLNQCIKRGENAVMKVFFTQFIPDVFDRVDFGTVSRLRD